MLTTAIPAKGLSLCSTSNAVRSAMSATSELLVTCHIQIFGFWLFAVLMVAEGGRAAADFASDLASTGREVSHVVTGWGLRPTVVDVAPRQPSHFVVAK